MSSELYRFAPRTRTIPRARLASLPTPVESYPDLARELGLAGLWIKRDDASSPLCGGNKVRKLEFALGRALSEGARGVFTCGPLGSHHVLATCAFARELGFEPSALHFPQPVTPHVLEVLTALAAARPALELARSRTSAVFRLAARRAGALARPDPRTFDIPPGGSSPLGVLGYVDAALELSSQIARGEVPEPDAVFVPAGTGGTLAGLHLGFRLARRPIRLIGVRAVDRVVANPLAVALLARRAGLLLARCGVRPPRIAPRAIEIMHGPFGPGYGRDTPESRRAAERFSAHTGLSFEPAYTAKAVAGVHRFAAAGARPRPVVLYWHTLGFAEGLAARAPADPRRALPAPYAPLFDG